MSASESSKEDRQLPASERRLQQAREDGQIARSRDLVHLAAMGALLALLTSLGPWMAEQALHLVSAGLRFDRDAAFDTRRMVPRLADLSGSGIEMALPIIAALALALGGAGLVVGGWNFTLKALEPKFDRLDPIAGIGRMFGARRMLEQLHLIALTTALLGCAGAWLWQHPDAIFALGRMPMGDAMGAGFGWLASGLTVLLGVVTVAAVADVPMQIFKHRAELRMTLEEAKQENKESEGDPHIKGERRRRAREMSRGRMLSAVPTATVIVTNPTHYAVALHYDETSMGAPRIVAMGADLMALKIREIAAASKVPTLEAPPLARALYKHGDIDAEVPVALYTAVAQVLAWVMRLQTALRPPALPTIAVPAGLDPLDPLNAEARA